MFEKFIKVRMKAMQIYDFAIEMKRGVIFHLPLVTRSNSLVARYSL